MAQQQSPDPGEWHAIPVPDPVASAEPAAPPPPPAPAPAVEIPGYGLVPLASIVERISGAVIDALIMFIPVQLVTWLLPDPLEFLAAVIVSAAYVIPMLGLTGATLGGRFMGISCLAVTGSLPGLGRSARRWLLLYAAVAVPLIGPLVVLAVGLSPLLDSSGRMQGLQDKAAGTYVVKSGPSTPVPRRP